MKIEINSKEMFMLLKKVASAQSSSPVLPILDSIKFSARGGVLTVTATDLEITIEASTTDVRIGKDGEYCLPAKLLLDTLGNTANQPITLEVSETTATIKTSNGKYKMNAESAADFPATPQPGEGGEWVECQQEQFLKALEAVFFATSTDELRPAMTGVLCANEGGCFTFVATDAHKLAKFKSEIPALKSSLILPGKAVKALRAAATQGAMSMSANNTNLFLRFGNVTIATRLIDARYPDYNAVIPVENTTKVETHRSDLLSAVKRLNLFVNSTTNQIICSFAKDEMTISGQDLDFSKDAVERLGANLLEGEGLTIGFNARFVAMVLDSFSSETITIEMSTANRAAIVRGANEGQMCLLMPVMLNAA
jgi:DNA polymerase III subunit beta